MTFEGLVKKISPTLKRITYKLDVYRSFVSAEDLYQEALVHLWHDFQGGRLADKTDSYILQGCYFHLKNYMRKIKIGTYTLSLATIVNEDGASLEETLPLVDKDSSEYFERLHSKLLAQTIQNNGLTTREKAILSFCAQDLTTRQIGQRLGISHVMVVKLLGGIRKKCKKYLD